MFYIFFFLETEYRDLVPSVLSYSMETVTDMTELLRPELAHPCHIWRKNTPWGSIMQ